LTKRKKHSKYTIGSLLFLLAFCFYMVYGPGRHRQGKPDNPKTENNAVKVDTAIVEQFVGKVTGIKDGDTFEVLYNGEPERIRLSDIDAPESAQPFGQAAKKYASKLCFGKTVTVMPQKKRDQYGRILGTVFVDETINVNAELVKAGYAWRYKYSRNKDLKALEDKARYTHAGLWQDEKPVDPWQWRKQHKSTYSRK